VAAAFNAIYRRVLPDSPVSRGAMPSLEAYSAFFTRAADGIRQTVAFGDSEQWRFDWDRTYARDEWLELVPTFGGHSQFPPAKREELLAGICIEGWLPKRPHVPVVNVVFAIQGNRIFLGRDYVLGPDF